MVVSLGADAALTFQHLCKYCYKTPGGSAWCGTWAKRAPPVSAAHWKAAHHSPVVWARNWPQCLHYCTSWDYTKDRIHSCLTLGKFWGVCHQHLGYKNSKRQSCARITCETLKGNQRVFIFHLMKNVFNSFVIVLFTCYSCTTNNCICFYLREFSQGQPDVPLYAGFPHDLLFILW